MLKCWSSSDGQSSMGQTMFVGALEISSNEFKSRNRMIFAGIDLAND